MDHEVNEYGACVGCGRAVITTTQQAGGELIRMTRHVDPGEDPETRCQYDGGAYLDGTQRTRQYPGDTLP